MAIYLGPAVAKESMQGLESGSLGTTDGECKVWGSVAMKTPCGLVGPADKLYNTRCS